MLRSLLILILALAACGETNELAAPPLAGLKFCSDRWYQDVEDTIGSGDAEGHGPDIASDEWKSVIEFRLGVRGSSDVPPRNGEAWCRYIDELTGDESAFAVGQTASQAPISDPGPSYACDAVEAGGIEEMICGDTGLSLLDRQLDDVYQQALAKATNEHPPALKAEQRGWIKGRDECWKSDDEHACVETEYQRRIAALRARYRLIPYIGPVHYFCEGNRTNEVVVTYFDTEPATLIAEHGDSVSLMYLQPSASGTRYEGRNESFRDHQGEVRITWGYRAPEMRCEKAP